MAQRLCKLSRHDIAASLTDIHRLVAQPKYLCRSCARSSSDKKSLCKPEVFSASTKKSETKVKPQPSGKPALKAAKKTLKAQKKYQKKLEKVLKKQRKLAKKQQALQVKFSELNIAQSSEYSLTSQYH